MAARTDLIDETRHRQRVAREFGKLSVFEAHEMRIAPVVGYDSIVYCVCGWCEHIDVYTGQRTAASTYVSDQPERITVAYRQHLES